ncbi:MAG: AMP-binding protein [Hyphomicrobiaceae bacterium]
MNLGGDTYESVRSLFRWQVPSRVNIAEVIVARHARSTPTAPALIHVGDDGSQRVWTFAEVDDKASRLANALGTLGVGRGDVVGVHLPQSPECLIAHVAILKRGAIVLPLFRLFGPEALGYRLENSGARAFITVNAEWVRVRDDLAPLVAPDRLATIVTVGSAPHPAHSFWHLVDAAGADHAAADTSADDPAVMIYTSGTTGNPKGALHAHRVLYGHLPGVMLPQERFPQAGDRFWTPADWAWIGGLLDVLWPSLFHGVAVLSSTRQKFDPEWAFDFMARHGVRNVFMPPTALRLMRQVAHPRARFGYDVRSIASGGETLGADLIAWGRETFGLTFNEFYGQTECNLVVGNCASLFEVNPGSMGRAIPGHEVEIVDDAGRTLPCGTPGIVAVRAPDPVMMLEYWRNPEATAAKFRGAWLLLGDIAVKDEQGYFWFQGRDDDIINSSGYRIGPGEVEDCLGRHPAVRLSGVVGLPDPVRGEVVAAFVVLNDGFVPDDGLAAAIQAFVRERLAAHEYPRVIRFIDEMPMTVTGKIRRKDLRESG